MITVGKLKKALAGHSDDSLLLVVPRGGRTYACPQGAAIAAGSIFVGSDEISFCGAPWPDGEDIRWTAQRIICEEL